MTVFNRCERCGGRLPKSDMLGGGCPRCMLELGYETESVSAKAATSGVLPASIGRYRILRVIGAGGMGIVYEAEQEQPRRTVALKIIKNGMTNPELLWRFELETEALGRLQHPGIAQIYDAGTVDTGFGPQPYFAMELIRGQQPREFAELHHLDTRQRIELMIKICDAVHHAHQRSLIHRDLKPANILVDEAGQPKILDFGVVRATDSDTRSTTDVEIGRLIGTLPYMSPEQASADPLELDIRTDVYSLGIILYELLTGRLPYTVSKKNYEAIQTIREKDPEKISAVNRSYRGDIETIVGTALEKDKTRRYQSAFGLAIDLRRFLNDEPIAARPPRKSYQLRKFTRRHKTLVAGVASVFVALVTGVSATTWYAIRASREAERAGRAETSLISQNKELIAERQAVILSSNQLARAEDQTRLEVENNKAQNLHNLWESLARASALDSVSRMDDDRSALLAVQAMRINVSIPGQTHILVEDALQRAVRLNPWTHNLLEGYETEIYCVAYSSDGMRIAAGGLDGLVRVWNLHQLGQPPLILSGHQGRVLAVAFAPDGETIASGGGTDNTVRIWDLRHPSSPKLELRFSPSPQELSIAGSKVSSVAFSANGEYLAAAGADIKPLASYTLRVWDLRNPSNPPILLYRAANGLGLNSRVPTASVTFSHTGLRLASEGSDRILRVWDLGKSAASPPLIHEFGVPSSPPPESAGVGGFSVAFSPDDTILASVAAGTRVGLWNLQDPDSLPRMLQGSGVVTCVAFSPNGHRLASGGISVRIWDLEKPGTFQQVRTQVALTNSVAFSPDGAYIATGSSDKTVRISEINSSDSAPRIIYTPALAPQMDSVNPGIARAGAEPVVANPGPVPPARISLTPVFSQAGAFSTVSSRIAALALTRTIFVWNLNNPTASLTLFPSHDPVQAVAISWDGTRLAAGGSDGLLRVWDMRTPDNPPVLIDIPLTAVKSIAFSRDGVFLAAGGLLATRLGSDINVRVWNLRNPGAPPMLLRGPSAYVSSISFSSDGSRLAAGNNAPSNSLLVWDLHRPDSAPYFPHLTGESVRSVAFSSDDRLLVGGSDDGTIRVWEARNLRKAPLVVQGGRSAITAVMFSPEGGELAFISDNEGAMLLDLQSQGRQPILFERQANASSQAIFLDGANLAIISGSISAGNVHVWPVWSTAADFLCTRVWRNLSRTEWTQYIGEGIPYQRTCPALPPGVGAPGAPKRILKN